MSIIPIRGRSRLTQPATVYMAKSYNSAIKYVYKKSSNSISDGSLRSPLGLTDTVPTFTPSGIQFRLNCWRKNLV